MEDDLSRQATESGISISKINLKQITRDVRLLLQGTKREEITFEDRHLLTLQSPTAASPAGLLQNCRGPDFVDYFPSQSFSDVPHSTEGMQK